MGQELRTQHGGGFRGSLPSGLGQRDGSLPSGLARHGSLPSGLARLGRFGLAAAVAAGALALAPAPVLADGGRDLDFARGLLDRFKWFDLAEKVAKGVEDSGSNPVEIKARAGFLRADILKQKARATGDAAVFEEYKNLLADLQKRYPDAQRAQFAVVDELLASVTEAQAIATKANGAGTPEEAAKLKKQARDKFEAAFGSFQAAIGSLTAQHDSIPDDKKMEDEARDLEYKRDLLEYLEASAYLSYGRTFEEGTDDRKKAMGDALKKLEGFLETRTGWFNLWSFAYRDKGIALAEVGQFEDAKILFDELTAIEPWFLPEDPQGQKEIKKFANDIALEAHFQHARTCNLAKAHAEAVDSIDRMFARKELGAETHHFGKLATFEKAKALAAQGRASEGATEVYQMVLDSKKSGTDKVPGTDMDIYGLTACKALSEMVELSGEVFPSPVQFHAALGYFFRGKPERGIWAYKGVIVSARGPEDRPYVVRALKELGDLYYHIDRYIESAIAYRQLYRQFPDDPLAAECTKRARTAVKKAVEAFGEEGTGPLTDLQKKIEDDLKESGEGLVAVQLKFKEAAELQKRQKYDDAAREYLGIEPEVPQQDGTKLKVPFYLNALSNAGYCYVLHFQSNPKANAEYIKKAEETLGRAASEAQKLDSPEDQALALYYLAKLYNDENVKRYADTLKTLAPFDGPLASIDKYLPRARQEHITAAVKLGKLDEAERAFKTIDRPAFGKDGSYRYAAFELGEAFVGAAEKVAVDDAAGLQAAQTKAAQYVYKWFAAAKANEATAQRELNIDALEWAGTVVSNGQRFAEAGEIFRTLLANFPREKAAAAQFRLYARVDLNLGWCLLKAGKFKEANEILSALSDAVIISERTGDDIEDVAFGKVEKTTPIQVEVKLEAPADKKGKTEKYNKRSRGTVLTRFNREYRLLEALAEARWEIFLDQRKSDEAGANRFLGLKDGVQDAFQQLYLRLRSMDDGAYRELATTYQLDTQSFELRKLEVFYKLEQIKFYQQKWDAVTSDINVQLQQGLLDDGVVLKDGNVATGQILSTDGGTVVLRTRGGEKKYTADQIARVNDHREIRKQIMELRDQATKKGG